MEVTSASDILKSFLAILCQELWELTHLHHWPSVLLHFWVLYFFDFLEKSCRPGPTRPTRSYASVMHANINQKGKTCFCTLTPNPWCHRRYFAVCLVNMYRQCLPKVSAGLFVRWVRLLVWLLQLCYVYWILTSVNFPIDVSGK